MNQPTLLDPPKSKPAEVASESQPSLLDRAIAETEQQVDALGDFASEIGIEAATKIANQLNHIVEEKKLFTPIGGKRHLWVEAWCTLASLCGLAPRAAWCKRIASEVGVVHGYEARVEVIRLSDYQVIGAGEAECWMDEQLKGKKRWTEKHAAKSMSQTRATSKAISQILRFIPVLAGYSGTPAEEVDGENGQPERKPKPAADPNAQTAVPRCDRVSRDEVSALLARWKKCTDPMNVNPEMWKMYVSDQARREFDVAKPDLWTRDDAAAVDKALKARDA